MRISRLLACSVPLAVLACSQPSSDSSDEHTVVYGSSRSALGGTLHEKSTEVLQRVGRFAEDSLYSCLLHGLLQGLPIGQAMADCEIKLLEDNATGFGSIDDLGMHDSAPFDPGAITAACSTGDPEHSQASGIGYTGYGEYTWGGDAKWYRGLSFEESRREKDIAIQEALELDLRFKELERAADIAKANLDTAKASGDASAIAEAQKAYNEAAKAANKAAGKALDASEKARKDPNLKGPSVSTPGRGESRCTQTLAAARELLRECHRTQWKTYACQKLQAKMNGCPDPALILVDPEQGYACGAKPDPEAVRAAAVAQCEERVKYGPGGDNPCEPLSIDKSGLYYRGKGSICNNPQAYIDPGQASCTQSFGVLNDGRPDWRAIIVMGLEKFGGPIFVLPPPPPPFDPNAPDPKPGPRGYPYF